MRGIKGGVHAKVSIEATYNVEGAKGLIKDGGSKRREAAKAAIESVGGKWNPFILPSAGRTHSSF
jgi:uncharacterized protein with GYD domain